jgi:hypothetical protein
MLKRAQHCELSIDSSDLAAYAALRDPRAPISKNFDPVKDPKRKVPKTDLVHESVTPRGRANGREHNDPPAGMKVASDG